MAAVNKLWNLGLGNVRKIGGARGGSIGAGGSSGNDWSSCGAGGGVLGPILLEDPSTRE